MSSSKSVSSSSSEDENIELRRGPWTLEEDNLLTQCIADQGEGRWNLLAKRSGLKRTGKSCRLRWLNYLKPDVKRGNLTPQEQLLILELHSKWGNRWSKIAQHMPGRTDNEIKNYWRTRIQKQARHLNIDTDSPQFQELVRRFWIPRLLQKSNETSSSATPIQNQPISLPLDGVSQQVSTVGNITPTDPNPCVQQSSDSDQNNGSCISFSETVYDNPTKVPHQILGDTTSQFINGLDHTNDFGTFTYDDDCYHVSSNVYEMDNFNMATTTTSVAGDVEYPVDDCQMAESNRVNNDFACSMWNMDELWQFGNLHN